MPIVLRRYFLAQLTCLCHVYVTPLSLKKNSISVVWTLWFGPGNFHKLFLPLFFHIYIYMLHIWPFLSIDISFPRGNVQTAIVNLCPKKLFISISYLEPLTGSECQPPHCFSNTILLLCLNWLYVMTGGNLPDVCCGLGKHK